MSQWRSICVIKLLKSIVFVPAALFCGILFLSPNTYAYNLSVSADDVSIDIVSGKTSIKESEVGIVSDCRLGYNFSIATSTSPSLYLGGDNTTTAIFNTVDGTNSLANSSNQNKWGYYFSAGTNNGNSSTSSNTNTAPTDSAIFSPLSTTATSLLTTNDTASSSDIDVTHSIYYGVNADSTVAPGSYKMGTTSNTTTNGTIDYFITMHPTCNVVNIAYDGNNADEGTMGAQGTGVIHTNVKEGDNISLIASNFSRSGYGFAGWSLDSNAGTKLIDSDTTNNPVIYGPQEDITLPDDISSYDTDNDGIVKLYAVWIPSQGNLQGWTGCNNLDTATYDSTTGALDITKNSVTALTDMRDHDTYAVARLADGKCWMIENLRLDNNATTPNWGDDFLSQGFGGVFTGLAAAEGLSLFNSVATANSLYSTDGSTANTISGNALSSRFPRYNNANTSTRATNPTDNGAIIYSYGNYYTWAAAMANTEDLSSYAVSEATRTSLCPSGWRLPTGGNKTRIEADDNNEFWNLIVDGLNNSTNPANYNSQSQPYYNGKTEAGPIDKKLKSYPNNFLYSGFTQNGALIVRGDSGGYWSLTAMTDQHVFRLYFGSNSIVPGTGNTNKFSGYPVRCVASDSETFALAYNANGGSGAPSAQSTTANGSATFTISSTTPTRSGYTFAGWIDEKGNEVQPSSVFKTNNPNAVLYARWTNNSCNPSATTIGTGNSSTDAVCLQDVTPAMKASLPTATSTTGTYNLIDARDGQSYTVAKLPDGNLWLTKNLNFGNSSDTLLTAYDTDLPSNTTFMSPASTSTFSTGADYYTTPQIQSNVTTYGGYYSYAAAIASTTAYSTANQNITTSICPKGWDLPISASYTYLKSSASLTNYATASVAPYSFTYGGYKNGVDFTSQTTRGDLWTSTNQGTNFGQELYIASSTFTIGASSSTTYYKYYGRNVRCIASNGTATVNYNANGGSGTMASQTGDINSIKISSNAFTAPTGYSFKNWNTAANGSGTTVAVSTALSSIASNGDTITLYAQWNPIYKITYVNNCATFNTGCTASTSNGTSVLNIILSNNPSTGTETGTLGATNKWTQTNYKITSWNTAADGSGTSYVPSSTFTVPAGSVPGDGITLYAQWTPTYTIVFDGNGADNEMTGMRSSSDYTVKFTNVAENDEIELLASNYYKTNYGFAGWSFDSSAQPGGSTTIYGPNESIIAPTSSTPGETKTLYAVWVASAGNIQNWSGCSSMSEGDVTALTDQRDNNVYTVGKLEDGNCWMMENLRLSNNTSVSNWGNDNLSQGFGGVFHGLAASESTNFSNSTTANSLYSINGSTTYTISGSNQGQRFPRYNNSNTASLLSSPTKTRNYVNTASPSNSGTYEGSTVYSYGNYYTWNAAMASTEDFTTESASESAGTSICPAGWHLPTGGASNGTNDFYDLTTTISGTEPETGSTNYKYWNSEATAKLVYDALKKFPNNFVWSGYWNASSASSRGSRGRYWSTSAFSSTAAYYLNYYSSSVYPATYNDYRYLGDSVRCVTAGSKPGKIIYLPNASDAEGTMGEQDAENNEDVELIASNFSRAGYGFAGWSENPNATVNGNNTIYGPNETITTASDFSSTGLTLYAVWVQSAGNLQSWNGCSSMNIGDVTALTDQRDNQTYAIAKLADSKCWMIENLRLESDSTIGNNNMVLAQNYNSSFIGLAAAEATEVFDYSTTANSLYSVDGSTASTISGQYNLFDRFPRYNNANTQSRAFEPTTNIDMNIYSYGNYYTWAAVIADTTEYENGNQSITSTSICPSGWHIPTGGKAYAADSTAEINKTGFPSTYSDFYNLGYAIMDRTKTAYEEKPNGNASFYVNAVNNSGDTASVAFRKFPNNFVYSGSAYRGSFSNRGMFGLYWSSTVQSIAWAHFLSISTNQYLYPGTDSNDKFTGNSIRCIAD